MRSWNSIDPLSLRDSWQATIGAISETRAAAEAAHAAHSALEAKVAVWESQLKTAREAHANQPEPEPEPEAVLAATEALQSQQWGVNARLEACEATAQSVNATVGAPSTLLRA